MVSHRARAPLGTPTVLGPRARPEWRTPAGALSVPGSASGPATPVTAAGTTPVSRRATISAIPATAATNPPVSVVTFGIGLVNLSTQVIELILGLNIT